MLVQFSCENFRSFGDLAVFSMLATSDGKHPSHKVVLPSRKGAHAVRCAAMYGANASGKSNLVKAIDSLRGLVVEGRSVRAGAVMQPFRLCEPNSRPTRFEAIFVTQGKEYTYGVALSPTLVEEEYLLCRQGSSNRLLFGRETLPDGEVKVDFAPLFVSKDVRAFLKYKVLDTPPDQTFLSAVFDGNFKEHLPRLSPVMRWFQEVLIVVSADAENRALEVRAHRSSVFRDHLATTLRNAGTGIEDVVTSESPIDWDRDLVGFAPEFREQIRSRVDQLEDDGLYLGPVPDMNGTRYLFRRNADGIALITRMHLRHGTGDGTAVDFDTGEESDGTQRLMHLDPVLFEMTKGLEHVLIIDELDRRLHTHLTRMLVEQALACTGNSQLVFTTHDTNLLDLDLLRRDEIWFVEKDAGGRSHLYSLAEFKVRPDIQVRKGYLNGRYGAIPFIGSVDGLGWTAEEGDKGDPSIAKVG